MSFLLFLLRVGEGNQKKIRKDKASLAAKCPTEGSICCCFCVVSITSDRVCVPYFLAVTLWKSCLLNACRSTSFRNPAEWHRAYQPAADAKSGTKTFLRTKTSDFYEDE